MKKLFLLGILACGLVGCAEEGSEKGEKKEDEMVEEVEAEDKEDNLSEPITEYELSYMEMMQSTLDTMTQFNDSLMSTIDTVEANTSLAKDEVVLATVSTYTTSMTGLAVSLENLADGGNVPSRFEDYHQGVIDAFELFAEGGVYIYNAFTNGYDTTYIDKLNEEESFTKARYKIEDYTNFVNDLIEAQEEI